MQPAENENVKKAYAANERDILHPVNANVLICLSGSPSSQKVIRAAARFSRSGLRGLKALYVDNGKSDRNSPTLIKNINLAESLGASVTVIKRKDVLEAIADYARMSSVTDLFIGYSGPSRNTGENHLGVYRLVQSLPDVDVHIISDTKIPLTPSKLDEEAGRRINLQDFLIMTAVMAGATAVSFLIDRSRFSNSNIVTIYILAVLITSVLTAERIYGIIASVLYILLFNFLFIEPRFSLLVYDPDYMVTYLVSMISAIITGNVSARMKQSTWQAMKNWREREEAQIVAENERFRSKLLRSISHDLRTPLTSISGNAANLVAHADALDEKEKQLIYQDIYEDSIWLIDLVENLLSITKLEESVEIHPVPEVVADVLESAVKASCRYKRGHNIILETDGDCLMAMMDVPLILQVVNNLISNAIKHTPSYTTIRIRDWMEDGKIMVSVVDDGPGIPDEEKERIFDLLYVGKGASDDSSRSLGLGLNLCKSILEAHGQAIRVEDAVPHGSIFVFSLEAAQEARDE